MLYTDQTQQLQSYIWPSLFGMRKTCPTKYES
jgi:hypothetical protein